MELLQLTPVWTATEKNDSTYKKYWIKRTDWGNVTFCDHMQRVQIYLQASSDYFSVPIYVWLKEPIRIVQWEKKAIPWNQNYVTTSTCALPHPIFPFTMHLELAFESHHYNSIVPHKNMLTVLQPPTIARHNTIVVTEYALTSISDIVVNLPLGLLLVTAYCNVHTCVCLY